MPKVIKRTIQHELMESAKAYPVTTILGPRQSGKTTLAKLTFPEKPYVNMEAPDVRKFSQEDPRRFLAQFPDGAILDEVQRTPEILSYIQVFVDEKKQNNLFILTGSHQLELQQEITQSLAGRTGILHLYPLSMTEIDQVYTSLSVDERLFLGGYPRIFEHNLQPHRFYRDYVQTYLERDLRQIVNVKDLDQFQRFIYLCASRVGQLIEYTHFANDLGISRHTVKEWLSVLKASFITWTLPPYFENFGKQIIKSPKLYFTDVGLLCYLLGAQESQHIAQHPLRGQIFENYVLLELIKARVNAGIEPRVFYFRDKQQNEIDIIIQTGTGLDAIEVKSSQTFHPHFLKTVKKFNDIASKKLVRGYVVYCGEHQQMIDDIQVLNYHNILQID